MPPTNELFELRPAALPDLDAVYYLIAQQNTADFGRPLLLLEELRQRWHASDFSLAKQTRAAISAANELVGYGEIRPYHPTSTSPKHPLPLNSASASWRRSKLTWHPAPG